jgi:tetratricopeptide (TPR) repeat protein
MSLSWRALISLTVTAVLFGVGITAWWRHVHSAEYMLRRGEELLASGDNAAAHEYAERLQNEGYRDHAHLLRGQALLKAGKLNPAIQEINEIPEEETALRLKAAETFGLNFLALQMRAEAEQLFNYILSKNPDHLNAHRGLAALYFDQGAVSKALHHAGHWSRLSPQAGGPHRFMGVIYMDMGDMGENNEVACSCFKEALAKELSPAQREEVKRELAEVLMRKTNYADAWNLLRELDPHSQGLEKTQELKVECLTKLNRAAELSDQLRQALAQFPNNASLLYIQARLSLDSGQLEEAAKLLERAVRADRHSSRCRLLLAQTYTALGRPNDAAEQIRQSEAAQKLEHQLSELTRQAMDAAWDQEIRLRLAALCDQLGRYDEAANWRRAAAVCRARGSKPSGGPAESVGVDDPALRKRSE